jgi:hypothetical protein
MPSAAGNIIVSFLNIYNSRNSSQIRFKNELTRSSVEILAYVGCWGVS